MYKKLSFLLIFFFASFVSAEENQRILVLVTAAPHKYFVEKIGGKLVDVEVLVPANADLHTFEPTVKKMIKVSRADLWFQVKEPVEERIEKALLAANKKMLIVSMTKGVELIREKSHCVHCSHYDFDPHYWLSVKEAKVQAKTVKEALVQAYPQHKKFFNQRLENFLDELDRLDKKIRNILKNAKGKAVMVSHPAYGYFCRDYSLKQISIEYEGKELSPRKLETILNLAKKEQIKKIFVQPQTSKKAAFVIAKQLNIPIVEINPYSDQYEQMMLSIAKGFSR